MRDSVIIIGGGAAGLAAACALGGADVRLLERQDRVGRKLLSTGNGRCNLTNMRARAADYHGMRPAAKRVLELVTPADVRAFFDSVGVPTVEDTEGRVYPMSRQAASVLDALRLSAAERGCDIVTGAEVTSVRAVQGGYEVVTAGGERYTADNVIIATGGLAAPKLGARGDGYRILESFGHRVSPVFPAVAALRTVAEPIRGLKGQRLDCELRLIADGRVARTETGEVLFAEDGLSGIASMQLARACNEALNAGKSVSARITVVPDGARFIDERARMLPKRPLEDLLSGVCGKRVGIAILRAAKIENLNRPAGSLNPKERQRLGSVLSAWEIPVTGTQSFDAAQVTAGGARLTDFDWETMGSLLSPGLYAAGEVLDVDGDCGGFNLHWAWATALIAARAIRGRDR